MNLKTIKYTDYENGLPQEGQHILSQQTDDTLIVYQAFNPRIAAYAVEHQQFGGPHYSYSRMSWIKPNFLWMMFRCGWAQKEEQKRVLAIELRKSDFEKILSQAVFSSFQADLYGSHEAWKEDLATSHVRLQWDPDHDPHGGKLQRRAIQLGLRGPVLEQFGKEWMMSITDITDFVLEQGRKLPENYQDLDVIEESVFPVSSEAIRKRLKLD